MIKMPTFVKHALAAASAATAAAALVAAPPASAQVNTLEGWALLPANTFADGPTSGQFAGAGAGGNPLPLVDRQPVQGFSAVLFGAVSGSFRVMSDNGFGAQGNSADTLLRVYGVTPDFRTATGGSGTVSAANYATGAPLAGGFGAASRITLSDPNQLLGLKVQADYTRYYNSAGNPLVDPAIKSGRLLTGADLDIEAMRQDKSGNLWFGDEFGPYLVKTDAQGRVLRREIGLPGVFAPQNEAVLNGSVTANLPGSGGFEGMAINPAGDTLYTLLERPVTGDGPKTLRINEFSIASESYTGKSFNYQLSAAGTNIGDMTAVDDHRFLVIERNGSTATNTTGGAPFKKIYLIDLNVVDANGFVGKAEIVDLMSIADPNDLNGDGSTLFTFPFVTIEDVLLLDAQTLLVINDNNYPGTGGRNLGSDNTEFLRIHLATPVPEPGAWALLLGGLVVLGRRAAGQRRRD